MHDLLHLFFINTVMSPMPKNYTRKPSFLLYFIIIYYISTMSALYINTLLNLFSVLNLLSITILLCSTTIHFKVGFVLSEHSLRWHSYVCVCVCAHESEDCMLPSHLHRSVIRLLSCCALLPITTSCGIHTTCKP